MFSALEEPTSTPIQRFQAMMPTVLEDYSRDPNPILRLKNDALPSISVHKREGQRRFIVRKVPWSTIKTAYYLIDAVNPSAAEARSIYKKYTEFVDLHCDAGGGYYKDDELLLLFIIDIMIQGIKASSATTYMAHIVKLAKRRGAPIKGPLVNDLRKMLRMLQLDDEVDHAVDISEVDAKNILSLLSDEAKAMAWFLINTGARVADLLHLEASSVMWKEKYVTIHFKCTKNRKNPHKVFTANYMYQVEPCFKEIMARMDVAKGVTKGKIFAMAGDEFNKQVRQVWHKDWSPGVWGERTPTSYSFRRLAIQRFVRQSLTEENGKWVVKWAKAMALTGHLRLETLRTRYVEIELQTLEGAELPEIPLKKVNWPSSDSSFWPKPDKRARE